MTLEFDLSFCRPAVTRCLLAYDADMYMAVGPRKKDNGATV